MFRKIILLGMAGVLVALLSSAGTAATTEEVLAKLTKQHGEMKTFEADMKMMTKSGEGAGTTMTGHQAAQVAEKDKKPVTLMNFRMKGGKPNTPPSDMLMVDDGEFLWQETKDPESGEVMVMKLKRGARKMDTGDAKEYTDQYDLKLVGDEEFDGQKMWVLEGAPKNETVEMKRMTPRGGMGMPPQAEQPGKIRMSVGQKDSYLHRTILYDKAGKETSETQMTNIKVNGKVDPKLFKYTPPPGATVMDMTKGMPGIPNLDDLKKMIPGGGE